MCRSGFRALALAAGLAVCAAHIVTAQTSTGDQLIARGALSYAFYCAACHGGNGGGSPVAHVPQLAGRNAAWLARQIAALRDAPRTGRSQATANHARVLGQLSAAQIEGIAEYLASLAPPPSVAQ
jgi:cytochrome c553